MNKRNLPNTPRVFQMYIDGQFADAASGETITRHSPAHGVPVATWPRAGKDDTERAIAAARNAFDHGPWAGMGAAERHELMALTRNLARAQGMAVLFTEHSMDVVFAHADRMIVLSRGRLIAEGLPEEVRNMPEVQQVYFGSGHTFKN